MDPKKTDKPESKNAQSPAAVEVPTSAAPPIKSPDASAEVASTPPASPTVSPSTTTPQTESKPVATIAEEISEPTPTSPKSEVASVSTIPDANASSGDDFGYTETKSNKLLYIFVFVLVVVLLSLVGLFFYKQFISTTAEQPIQEVAPTVAVSPVVTPANEEEAELDQIEIPDIDKELQDIQQDIKQL